MRKVEVSKSGYEEGYKHGEAVRGSWQRPRNTQIEGWLAWAKEIEDLGFGFSAYGLGSSFSPSCGSNNIKKWTQEDALEFAAWLHEQKMRSLPDLTVFPELRGMDKYLDDSARGFAEGAQIDIREIYLICYSTAVAQQASSAGPAFKPQLGNCTEVAMFGCPGGTVMGKGWDDMFCWYGPGNFRRPSQPSSSEVNIIRQQSGGPVRGYLSSGLINEKGLAFDSGGGARYEYEPPSEVTLFPAPVREILMASCATVDEAVELLTRYREYWGQQNGVVLDANGDWALIEKSRHDIHVTRGRNGFVVTTYGGCDSEPMRRLTDTTTGLFRFYQKRLAKMREIGAAAESAGRLGIEAVWDMVLHHDPEAPGCVHKDTRPPGVVDVCFGCFGTEYRVEDDGSVHGRQHRRTIIWEGDEIIWACEVEPVTGEFIIRPEEPHP